MQVKRYTAADMRLATDAIIAELGDEALILSSRRVRKKGFLGFFSRREVEVTVAIDAAKPAEGPDKSDEVSGYIRLLEKRMDSLDNTLKDVSKKLSAADTKKTYPAEIEVIFERLLDNGTDEKIAREIADKTVSQTKKQPGLPVKNITLGIIAERLGAASPLKHRKGSRKIAIFTGPTGAGKTTSIVKIAADFAINQKKKVGIINTDTFRVGAREQLKTYADIMKLPLCVANKPGDLKKSLETMADRDVIFIDTAGKRPGDEQHKADILSILAETEAKDIFVCVPATLSAADAKDILDTYSFVPDYKLILTKLDETRRRGLALSLRSYAKKPIAYVATGQNVPDDIEIFAPEKLAADILGEI